MEAEGHIGIYFLRVINGIRESEGGSSEDSVLGQIIVHAGPAEEVGSGDGARGRRFGSGREAG